MQRMVCPHCGSTKCKPVVPESQEDIEKFLKGLPPFDRKAADGETDDLFLCMGCKEEYYVSEALWTSEGFEEAMRMIQNGEPPFNKKDGD